MKIFKYILSVFLTFTGFSLVVYGDIGAGIIIFIIGGIILPPISESLKEKLKFWRNRAIRYSVYIGLFFTSSFFMDIDKQQKETKQSNIIEDVKNNTDTVVYNQKTDVAKNDFSNIESIKWRKEPPTKEEIKGDWFHIVWFNLETPNDKTFYKMGDGEQKKLILTNNTYQTSSISLGENPLFNYELKNGKLIVKTRTQLASEIYNNKVSLSKDKKYLRLERDYSIYIYTRKQDK